MINRNRSTENKRIHKAKNKWSIMQDTKILSCHQREKKIQEWRCKKLKGKNRMHMAKMEMRNVSK